MALGATLEDDDTVASYVDGERKTVTAEEHRTVTSPATGEEFDTAIERAGESDDGNAASTFETTYTEGWV